MGASPAGTGSSCLLSTIKLIRSWALSISRNSGNFSSWLAPLVYTCWWLDSSSSDPAYSVTWFKIRNHWPDTCSLRFISVAFICSADTPVKWVFSR